MSRLTYKNKCGYFEARGERTGLTVGYDGSKAVVNGDVVDRLAAYEDTGLEPKQVRKIANVLQEIGQEYNCRFEFVAEVVEKYAKYVDAEQEGRLVVPPCKERAEINSPPQ